jgi:hypothetical protein
MTTIDRDVARALMRHSDAVDLLLGAMSEIANEAPDTIKAAMQEAIFESVNKLHVGVRAPILREFPDLDRDQK